MCPNSVIAAHCHGLHSINAIQRLVHSDIHVLGRAQMRRHMALLDLRALHVSCPRSPRVAKVSSSQRLCDPALPVIGVLFCEPTRERCTYTQCLGRELHQPYGIASTGSGVAIAPKATLVIVSRRERTGRIGLTGPLLYAAISEVQHAVLSNVFRLLHRQGSIIAAYEMCMNGRTLYTIMMESSLTIHAPMLLTRPGISIIRRW